MYTDDTLINIADNINVLCYQYPELKGLSASQVVVMGTQSSGKSSVLNRLIGFDVLPVGKNMVTRTPIYVKMLYNELSTQPKLVMYVESNGENIHEFEIVFDKRNDQQKILTFKTKLTELTNIITGNDNTISEIPIHLNIYWNEFKTNFSFVDLPGRVLIAKDGQSETLKCDIDSLIKKKILCENTIVMLVLQSKTDLETDSGLELFKEIEKSVHFKIKSIGVLTKPDTMNTEDIHLMNDFVTNRIDQQLMLSDGYFIVNNKSENEESYFNTQFGKTSDVCTYKRYGITNLQSFLKLHLVQTIKKCLPHVKKELSELLKSKQIDYQSLGGDSLDNKNRQMFVNKIISQLCSEITNSINSNSLTDNVGYHIGNSIRNMIISIENISPFNDDIQTTKYFNDLVKCSRGYRLTSQASLETMIERCLEEHRYNPQHVFISHVLKCISEIEVLLINSINKITNCGKIDYIQLYPRFKEFILDIIRVKLREYCDNTLKEINKFLEKQKLVIWSTSGDFTNILNQHYEIKKETNTITNIINSSGAIKTFTKSKNIDKCENIHSYNFEFSAEQVRSVSIAYYKTIITRAKDMFAQDIIYGIIAKMKTEISGNLLYEIFAENSKNLDEFLVEDSNVVIRRSNIKKTIGVLDKTLAQLYMF